MKRWYSWFVPRSGRSVAWLAILIVFAISTLDLVGWMLNITLLKSIKSEWISMRVITALCLALSAIELAILQKSPPSFRKSIVSQAPAILVGLVGLLTIAVYAINMVKGQEASLEKAPLLNLFLAPADRMALLTAIIFVFIACALVLLAAGGRRAANIAHVLLLPAAIASYLVPVSYLLDVQAMHSWLNIPVALHTGIAFCALCLAVFCVRPDTWLMTVFTGDHAGGVMARRLLPGLLVIPLVIGWLRIYGERTEVFRSEVGVALVAITYTVCLLGLVWLSARSVDRTDEKRRESETRLRLATEAAQVGILEWDAASDRAV